MVGADDREETANYARKHDLPFPMLLDEHLAVIRRYELKESGSWSSVPAAFVIGRDGVIRFRHVGKTVSNRVSAAELLRQLDPR